MKTQKITVLNPYTNKVIKKIGVSSKKEIIDAINKARKAFFLYKNTSAYDRRIILKKSADMLEDNKETFARLITQETGKPIVESRVEVDRAHYVIEQSAEEAIRISGEVLPCDVNKSRSKKIAITTRKPVGVIAAITPFNFPLNIVAHKIAPALAAGNTVIVKPSPHTPLTALKLRKLFIAAGLPENCFLIVNGFRQEVEDLIAGDISMISFTGSVKAGKNIAHKAGIKKMHLELGGNDPLIVYRDADLDRAVEICTDQRFRTAGQRCTAVKRLFVEKSVFGEFMEMLIGKVKKLRIGNPVSDKTDVGPLISRQAAVYAEKVIKEAVKKGAKLLIGGGRENNFIMPAILTDVPENCDLFKYEIFAPILPVFTFIDTWDVIKKVNSSEYGLQAGVFTNSIEEVKILRENIDAATLVVNDGPGFRVESLPFGGIKNSGYGREGIRYAVYEMTEINMLIL